MKRTPLRLLAATAAITLVLAASATVAPQAHAILPPEPPRELAQRAGGAVVATATKVKGIGPVPTTIKRPSGWVGPAADQQAQTVTLKVAEVIRWAKGTPPKVGATITVTKPLRPYSVKTGDTGVFLLDACAAKPTLLGRYGTAFSDPDDLRAALRQTPALPC